MVTEETKEKNRELLNRFPFLRPRDWGGNPIPDEKLDFAFTFLDEMPTGWRNAFGEQLCEEISEALTKNNIPLEKYQVLQVKEKFGYLHWYDVGCKDTNDVIRKYEDISERTCCRCGKPATKISRGWICPYCDDCATELSKNGYIKFDDIPEEDEE